MPGGVGKVSETMISATTGKRRKLASLNNANEIFFNLDAHRVYFDSCEGYLYFVDAPADLVTRTIRAALSGIQGSLVIEQLHLDTHRFFNAASRVALGGEQADAVLIALRLAGVAVTIR